MVFSRDEHEKVGNFCVLRIGRLLRAVLNEFGASTRSLRWSKVHFLAKYFVSRDLLVEMFTERFTN